MKVASWIALLLVLGIAVPLIAGVTVDYRKGTDFSRYRSFSWVEGAPADDPEAERLIHTAVTNALLAKGLVLQEEDGDLLVRTASGVRDEEREDVDILGYDQRWAGTARTTGPEGEYLHQVEVGTVVVDLLDGFSKLQMWRGTATAVLQPELTKKSEKRVQKAVDKMFSDFPPAKE